MTEAAYFIEARALILAYEAVHYPDTAATGIAWILRARDWAKRRGLIELEETLTAHFVYIGANLCAMNEAA